MTFLDARHKLLAYVRNEVCNGELTERGLARLVGISQPHAHNVLKGIRTLSPDVSDLILKYLHLSLLDMAPLDEIEAQLERRRTREHVAEVAFLATPIGPGCPWPAGVNWRKSHPLPFPCGKVPAELVMAKLVADPARNAALGAYDIGLLDTSEQRRTKISPHAYYAIERGGEVVLRHIRPGAHRYYLVKDDDLDQPRAWEPLPVTTVQLQAAIRARVIWLGREDDREARSQRGRFLDKPITS